MKVLCVAACLALCGLLVQGQNAGSSSGIQACKSVTKCYRGGMTEGACEISSGSCPPCLETKTFGCYEFEAGTTKCPFGTNCNSVFSTAISNATSSHSSGGSKKEDATFTTAPTTATSYSRSSAGSGKAASGASNDKKSGISMVAIIGGGVGVIAVVAVLMMLVKRSRSEDDDDDEMETPVAMNKPAPHVAPQTSGTQYAPYAQPVGRKTSGAAATPTNRVLQYYHENAQQSPRSTGFGSGAQAPPQQPMKVVRPMSNPQPYYNAAPQVEANYSAAPVESNYNAAPAHPFAAPVPSAPHAQQQQHLGVMVNMHAEPVTIPPQDMPNTRPEYAMDRRESFEF